MNQETFRILAVLTPGVCEAGEILERIERMAGGGGAPSIPTLYRRLSDCLERGWIEALPSASGSSDGPGRPGQRYRITPAGTSAARAEAMRWRGFAHLVLSDGGGG